MQTDQFLSFDDGIVQLGNDRLPGVFISMTVNAGVKFDRAERDHMSGKNKIPLGWEDSDVRLTLDLLCDDGSDCYAKLKVINLLFKGADKKASPQIYIVTNRHLRARGIDKVVFSGLETDEDDQSDVIRAVLTFSEHLPAVVKREKQVTAAKTKSGAPAVKAKPATSPAIVQDSNPFTAGFNSGLK
jgi:hypothetical protein